MNPIAKKEEYQYKVGGSLGFNHPTYVSRQADRDLLEALQMGHFCYVFNCRQMGKSSLRVRVMRQLQARGMSCASIDITSIGSDVSVQQWYGGVITQLFLGFNLAGKVNLKAWLRQKEGLAPVQKFGQFIDEILLVNCSGEKIFIFIDEIDKVLSLNFSLDDFFSLIRFCYNQRAENPNYDRLTFALFGVATPSALIQDKTQTAFNIGKAIELTGFTIQEAKPLEIGLKTQSDRPNIILQEIINWTGGQPFLTQKLCQLIVTDCSKIATGDEAKSIENLIRSKIITNWESHDEPVHLKTIRDRLLKDDRTAARLLGLYQQIWQQGKIVADDSPEQSELSLSGLVVKQAGNLKIYNRIYREVFNRDWIERELTKLRPYSESIAAWANSGLKDESRLLRGKALQDAFAWSVGKNLNHLDYQFLTASQQREAEINLEAQKQANQILTAANQKAIRRIRIGSAILIASLIGSAIATWKAQDALQKQQQAQVGALIQRKGDSATRQFEFGQIEALMLAMQAGQELHDLIKDDRLLQEYPATSPLLSLQQILDRIREKNQLQGHQESINSISFSPDGQTIATTSRDGTARLWDIRGNQLAVFQGHQGDVYGVNFNPDGKLLATTSKDGTIALWDLSAIAPKMRPKLQFRASQGAVYSLTFSPKGNLLATAAQDGIAKLWNLQGKELMKLKGHRGAVYGVTFSPDGKLLATASSDKTAKIWNLQAKELVTLTGHQDLVNSINFSPDGKLLATGSSDDTAKIWNLQGKQLVTLQGHQDLVNSITFSPDGKTLATASNDGTTKLWNLQGKQLFTFKGHQEPVYDVKFSPDSQLLATASSDGTAKLWDIRGNAIEGFPSFPLSSVSFSQQKQLIATTSKEGMVYLWDLQGHLRHEFQTHGDWIYSISFSVDGNLFATASRTGTTKLWDIKGNQLAEFKGDSVPVYSVSISPDNQLVAVASRDGIVWLWDLKGKSIAKFPAHREAIYSISFSPDGKSIATASKDGTAKLWNLQGNLKAEFKGHQDTIYSLIFSSDGKQIATASRDGTAKLWDIEGNKLAEFKGDAFPVYSVSFKTNNNRIATGSSDGTVRIWDLQGNLRAESKGDENPIYGINFTSFKHKAIAVSKNGTVRIWPVLEGVQGLDKLLSEGCTWLKDYLASHPKEQEKLAICK
jgi:WD40 repeat protein